METRSKLRSRTSHTCNTIQKDMGQTQSPPRTASRKALSESNNAFRKANIPHLEEILMFKEKPRQFLFLGLIITFISIMAYQHDSDVCMKYIYIYIYQI